MLNGQSDGMERSYSWLRVGLTAIIALTFFTISPPSFGAEQPLKVVTTIKPIHSILSNLLIGSRAPELLIQGEDLPYNYKLTSLQKNTIKESDLVVWIGPELEDFMEKPLSKLNSNTTVFTLLDQVELKVLPSRWDSKLRDPFIWLDSRNMLILTDELTRLLIRLDPANTTLYEKNRKQLLYRLAGLDRQLEYGYRGMQSGIGMSYYDTLQYFEQSYALKLHGSVVQSPLHPMGGLSLLESRAKLDSGDFNCLLTEQQIKPTDLALLLDKAKDQLKGELNISKLDSFGVNIPAGNDHYFKLMKINTATIKRCLQH